MELLAFLEGPPTMGCSAGGLVSIILDNRDDKLVAGPAMPLGLGSPWHCDNGGVPNPLGTC